jgi:hypothetical protein
MALIRARATVPRAESLDSSEAGSKEKLPHVSVTESTDSLALGAVANTKKFWWQRGKEHDDNAIATQVYSTNVMR